MSEQNYPKLQADYDSLRRKYRELKSNFDTLKSEHETLSSQFEELQELASVREEDEIRAVIDDEVQKVAEAGPLQRTRRDVAGSVESQVRGTPEGVRGTQAPRQVQRGCDQGRRAQGSPAGRLEPLWIHTGR